MDEVRGASERHAQGPHRQAGPQEFVPLHLRLDPEAPPLEVHRPEVVVGRHTDADIRLALPDISRRHCRLVFENPHWRVFDLGSLNGVFINGERMHEATLYPGDELQLANIVFRVEYGLPAAVSDDETLGVEVLQSIANAIKDQKRAS